MAKLAIGQKQQLGKQGAGQLMGTSQAETGQQLMDKGMDGIREQHEQGAHMAKEAMGQRQLMGTSKDESGQQPGQGAQGGGTFQARAPAGCGRGLGAAATRRHGHERGSGQSQAREQA